MEKTKELRVFAEEIRVETIKELAHLGFGHMGGSMSVTETLAVLYGGQMNYDPKNPAMENRDRLVMSKGHAGPALYAALALKGFFPLDRLNTLNQGGTTLPSHCDRLKTPGVDMTTGSLGQGVSAGVGMALAARMDKRSCQVCVVAGDGECDEGQVWEAALFAAAQGLDNLTLIIDQNHLQLDGSTDEVLSLGSLEEKLRAFGWQVLSVEDGHSIPQLRQALSAAWSGKDGRPTAVVLNTIKGKGYPAAMRGPNHHMIISDGDFEEAMEALAQEEQRLREREEAAGCTR